MRQRVPAALFLLRAWRCAGPLADSPRSGDRLKMMVLDLFPAWRLPAEETLSFSTCAKGLPTNLVAYFFASGSSSGTRGTSPRSFFPLEKKGISTFDFHTKTPLACKSAHRFHPVRSPGALRLRPAGLSAS